MKKIRTFFLLIALFLSINAKSQNVTDPGAQYTPDVVYTPKSTPVAVDRWVKNDWSSTDKNTLKSYHMNKYNNRIIFEDEATFKYNCHAFAWADRYGVWMNNNSGGLPQVAKYWNDFSYIKVSNPSISSKVFYGTGDDHSAITTFTPNVFKSKWGPSPRFIHDKNDSPYYTTDLNYYDIAFTICSNSSQTITAGSWQNGYYWEGSKVTFSSTSTQSSIVSANGNGAGWVKIKDSSGNTKATYDVWVGVPLSNTSIEMNGTGSIGSYGVISNNISVCLGEMLSLLPQLPPNVPYEGIIEYEYVYSGTLIAFGYNNYGVCTFVVPYSVGSTFSIQYRRRNACGWSSWSTIINGIVTNCSKSPSGNGTIFIVYPNPTNGILNVEIDPNNINQSKSTNMVTTYNIFLFDIQGNLVRNIQTKTEKVQFDVSNLPAGMYYLHIYDGVSGNPEMHPIMIQ